MNKLFKLFPGEEKMVFHLIIKKRESQPWLIPKGRQVPHLLAATAHVRFTSQIVSNTTPIF